MRRKTSPRRLCDARAPRPLTPARSSRPLPTAAAVAIALSAIGCSTVIEERVTRDPAATGTHPAAPAPTASASAPAIEPMPMDLDGEMPAVKPIPVPAGKATGVHHSSAKGGAKHPVP